MSVKNLHSLYFLYIKILYFAKLFAYKGKFKDLEYTIYCEMLHLEKKKTDRQSQFVVIV